MYECYAPHSEMLLKTAKNIPPHPLDLNRPFVCVKDNSTYTSILLGLVLLLQRTINTHTFCWALCFC